MITLKEISIRQHLNLRINSSWPINLHLLSSVDSTNRYLKELHTSQAIEVCCAEMQTEGRGRFGRTWHSPFGDNIYCSIRWPEPIEWSRLSGFSLMVSIAILATLKRLGINDNIRIKWPNDLLWQDKKLCGNLVELTNNKGQDTQLITGIGLNVNATTTNASSEFSRPPCSLQEITGEYFDRNIIISELIVQLQKHIEQFMLHRLSCFLPFWQQYDYLYGKKITLSQTCGLLTGLAQGITPSGQLILIDEKDTMHFISSGEASLHR